MKSRLIDAGAFVIGAILAFMIVGPADVPWPVRLALTLLSPGYYVGLPIVFIVAAVGLPSIAFYFLVGVLTNGLIFALASSLIRNARKGQRRARLVLALGMATWVIWGVVWTVQSWPWPERVAPVDLASSLAGRWTGVLHAPRGDPTVILVCHPRTDHTLDGYLYVDGHDMGPFGEGVYGGDSLSFGMVGFEYRAHVTGKTMGMVTTVSGIRDSMGLQFVSADTSRPAIQEGAVGSS